MSEDLDWDIDILIYWAIHHAKKNDLLVKRHKKYKFKMSRRTAYFHFDKNSPHAEAASVWPSKTTGAATVGPSANRQRPLGKTAI